jgi:paired amphipathic helix protein Sin3a
LKPNLGGSGKSIHHRVIKKIYGREAGLEVIQSMQDLPAIAIPVVLTRLKQKEEEWKRAQREWNKVWREVDARNYQKSLDHQGITFKAADKKALTTKTFLSQIEAVKDEQMAKTAALIDPLFARARPRHQLEFVIDDELVLQDAVKLSLSFLDRTLTQINLPERKRIEGFLRSFIPLFFALDHVSFNAAFVPVQETADSEFSDDVDSIVDDGEVSSNASSSSKAGRGHRKVAGNSGGGDLRKRLLKSEQAKLTGRKTRAREAASPSTSRLPSPGVSEAMDIDSADEAAKEPAQKSTRGSGSKHTSRQYIFFGNSAYYSLIRLIEVSARITFLLKCRGLFVWSGFVFSPGPLQGYCGQVSFRTTPLPKVKSSN